MAKVTTFYSYKGGSGRSMTLANVAWALATNGERVLAIDWDLEAPGLHRYFHPFLKDPEQATSRGLVDRLWEYIEQLGSDAHSGGRRTDRFNLANCDDIIQPLELPTKSKGGLHLLTAGRQDDEYSLKVGGLDWANFYARFDGEAFIERLMEWARGKYTHILIDSRTGVADTAGICTAQLPDAVIICLVYNRQSIEGSSAIARSITKARQERIMGPLSIRFIPCRVEERGVVEAARRYAASRLSETLAQSRFLVERQLRLDEIRHFPWCAFEEKLAVFQDVPDERGSLLDEMHELAKQIAARKNLKIENIDANILEAIWRRAAFDDPRIADLEALSDASLDEAKSSLMAWVNDALDSRDERTDWLMALGEAAISFAGRADDEYLTGEAEFLGRSGLSLANRAMVEDPVEYTLRLDYLLQSRAGQLQKLHRYDEAQELLERSCELFLREGSAISNWRAARSLERLAEISIARKDSERALAMYQKVADLYASIGDRNLPLGAKLDPVRSLRLLAEQLLVHGDRIGADRVSSQAVQKLGRIGPRRSAREAAEVANILATRAEIAALLGANNAEREIMKVRMRANNALGSSIARNQLERRLLLAEARLRKKHSEYDRALDLLDLADAVEVGAEDASQDLVELRASILLEAGRPDEAAETIVNSMKAANATLRVETIELLRQAYLASGREEDFANELGVAIAEGGERRPALFKAAVSWLLSHKVDISNSVSSTPENTVQNLSHILFRPVDKSDKE